MHFQIFKSWAWGPLLFISKFHLCTCFPTKPTTQQYISGATMYKAGLLLNLPSFSSSSSSWAHAMQTSKCHYWKFILTGLCISWLIDYWAKKSLANCDFEIISVPPLSIPYFSLFDIKWFVMQFTDKQSKLSFANSRIHSNLSSI